MLSPGLHEDRVRAFITKLLVLKVKKNVESKSLSNHSNEKEKQNKTY